MNRILIVNVNWLGDALFTTPFIRVLREAYPDAYIASLVVPRCQELLEDNPQLDELIIYDEGFSHKTLFGKLLLISHLKSKRFDTAFILRKSLTRTMLLFLSGIPNRIGYDNRKSGFLLTHRLKSPNEPLHKVDYFLNIAHSIGIDKKVSDYELYIKEKDKKYIDELLKKEGVSKTDILIGINPGANWNLKRWPGKNFAQLIKELQAKYSAKIIITGASDDIELTEEIAHLSGVAPIIACGKTTIKQLAALFQRTHLVISNDSGPMHIAASQKVPLIALFGPTSPQITGPYGSGRSIIIRKDVDCELPCYNLDCQENHCMMAITVDDVLDKVKEILNYRFTHK